MPDSTRPPLRILALLLGLSACQHTEPFGASANPPVSGPLNPGNPSRLTYNPGEDAYPVSAPDGSYLLYQAENPNTLDRDRCLFLLPPTGGTQTLEACDQAVPSEDSTNVFGPAAVSSTGRVILYESVEPIGAGGATSAGVYLAPALPVLTSTQILSMPVPTSGALADKLTSLRWVGDSGFLALGVQVQDYVPCFQCTPDTVETGVGVVWTTLGNGSPTAAAVAGTARASSFAFVAPDTVYFTLNNDARILRTRIGGGPVDSVFAFPAESTDAPIGARTGSPAIVRGLQVSGGVAYAITGGRIEYHPDSGSGEIQRDWGGKLHKVILATGVDSLVSAYTGNPQSSVSYVWIRNPTLSPAGNLTAEGRPVTIRMLFSPTLQFIGSDTLIPRSTNLWQYAHP